MGLIKDRMEERRSELKGTVHLPDLDMDFTIQKPESGVMAAMLDTYGGNDEKFMMAILKLSCISPDFSGMTDIDITNEMNSMTIGDKMKLQLFLNKFALGMDKEVVDGLSDFQKMSRTKQT